MRILTPEEIEMRVNAFTATEGRFLPPLTVGEAPIPLAHAAMDLAELIMNSSQYFAIGNLRGSMHALVRLMRERYTAEPEEAKAFMDELQHVAIDVPPALDGHRL
jgi:hypothetical protein